jgi:hypothetical protein
MLALIRQKSACLPTILVQPGTGSTSLGFYLAVSVISSVSTTMAVQIQPVSRTVSSPALCLDGYSWMDDSKGYSPCLTVAYVEGACSGNSM